MIPIKFSREKTIRDEEMEKEFWESMDRKKQTTFHQTKHRPL